MHKLSNEITEALEANSLKGPIPGIVAIWCCTTEGGNRIQLVTSRPGPMECPECGRHHEVTEAMLKTGVARETLPTQEDLLRHKQQQYEAVTDLIDREIHEALNEEEPNG